MPTNFVVMYSSHDNGYTHENPAVSMSKLDAAISWINKTYQKDRCESKCLTGSGKSYRATFNWSETSWTGYSIIEIPMED